MALSPFLWSANSNPTNDRFCDPNSAIGPKKEEEEQNSENCTVISSYLIPVWPRVWKTPPITWALRVGDGKGSEGVPCNLHELAPFISFL